MTDLEIHEWLNDIVRHSKFTKLEIVDDLLKHAGEDEMSEADRTICVRAKELLNV